MSESKMPKYIILKNVAYLVKHYGDKYTLERIKNG